MPEDNLWSKHDVRFAFEHVDYFMDEDPEWETFMQEDSCA